MLKSLAIASLLVMTGCAASPLYAGRDSRVTPGEVPRDGNGEPLLNRLPPPKPDQSKR